MNSTWNYTITNSFAGFKRFVSNDIYYIITDLETYRINFYDTEERVSRYVQAVHYKQLYDVFLASLTIDEEKCVNYVRYHDPTEKQPEYFSYYFDCAYEKWKRIFCAHPYKTFKEIDPKLLGLAMKCVRKQFKKSITLTAEILGTDRVTLSHYEHGRRLPPLNFIFKFCKLFSISIDSLLKISTH